MRSNHNALVRYGWPFGVAALAGAVACSSSSTSSAEAAKCSSPAAISRFMNYPNADQGEPSTWGHIIIHVSRLGQGADGITVGFTDPGGNVHTSRLIPPGTLEAYPDAKDGGPSNTDRVVMTVGQLSTKLIVKMTADCGSEVIESAPKVQFGVNGNPGQPGRVVLVDAPPTPSVGDLPGVAAYPPDFGSPPATGNVVPATPNTTFTSAALFGQSGRGVRQPAQIVS